MGGLQIAPHTRNTAETAHVDSERRRLPEVHRLDTGLNHYAVKHASSGAATRIEFLSDLLEDLRGYPQTPARIEFPTLALLRAMSEVIRASKKPSEREREVRIGLKHSRLGTFRINTDDRSAIDYEADCGGTISIRLADLKRLRAALPRLPVDETAYARIADSVRSGALGLRRPTPTAVQRVSA